MFAVPLSLPGGAISMPLLLTVASTSPSTTSTSQSDISTPLSLMLMPTNNLLGGASGTLAIGRDCGVREAGGLAGVEEAEADDSRAATGLLSRGGTPGVDGRTVLVFCAPVLLLAP